MEHQMDLLIDQSTWVPVLFRSSPVRSIRSRNYTQQQSPVSHRVTVKYRNHTQIPKNHPLDREKTLRPFPDFAGKGRFAFGEQLTWCRLPVAV
jgi:hypothetical protein